MDAEEHLAHKPSHALCVCVHDARLLLALSYLTSTQSPSLELLSSHTHLSYPTLTPRTLHPTPCVHPTPHTIPLYHIYELLL